MIARLSGKLIEAELSEVVVDVNGVGYLVSVPLSTFDKLPKIGEPITLFTYLSVREDALQLFGFFTREERLLFRLLTTVTGVGPRLALNALGAMPVSSFCQAIANADVKLLSRINGVGKRVAERLVVELKDKIADFAPQASFENQPGEGARKSSKEVNDAVAALQTLGFKAERATKAVMTLLEDEEMKNQTTENLIRKALQLLNS